MRTNSVEALVFFISVLALLSLAPMAEAQVGPPDYVVLDTERTSTMQQELQEAADNGYRLVPGQGSWGPTAILEKAGDPEPIEYFLLATSKTGTLQNEIDEAGSTRWVLGRAHARAPCQRPGGDRRVTSENWRRAMGKEIESPVLRAPWRNRFTAPVGDRTLKEPDYAHRCALFIYSTMCRQEVTHAYKFRRSPCSSSINPRIHVPRPHGRGPSCRAGLPST